MATIDPFSTEGAKQIAAIAGQQPAPISANVLQTPALPKLPQPEPTPVPATPPVPTIDSIYNTAPTDLENKVTRLATDQGNTAADLAGEGAFRTVQEQTNDITGKKKTANDLATSLNNLKSEADQIPLSIQNEFAGRGATAGGVAPIQSGLLRNNTIRQLGVSAMLNAANGNLSTAQDQVDSAVKAKFDPLKAQLAAQKAQLDAITPLLSREDAKRAEKQSALLADRTRALDKAESDQKAIYETMLTAAQYGADAATLRKIQNAASPEAAATAAAAVLGTKFKNDKAQQEFENNIKLASLAIEQRKANNESVASADPAQILAYAQQYASSGTIPTGLPKGTFGLVSQVAKDLPKPDGAIIDVNTGTKPNMSDAKIDGLAALADITNKVADLKVLDTQRNHGLVSGALSKVFGSADAQRYVDLRTEIVDLLSRARTGAALTASEEKFYADQLPARVSNVAGLGADSQLRIDNFASKIAGTLDTKLKANQAALVGFSKINIGGKDFTVGETVTNAAGQKGRINADGTITLIQ